MSSSASLMAERPAPDREARRPAVEVAAGEKRARFNHETTTAKDDDDDYGLLFTSHSVHDDVIYETVEEDYEFDSMDDYDILEPIGLSSRCGGGGLVRARDRCTGEPVAVRRVPASVGDGGAASLPAVVREAACLAACRGHPSVLQLRAVAADESTGDLFVVTEPPPVGFDTLRSRLTQTPRRRFLEVDARALMRQLLGAVAAMHGAGVTHRDICPDTILVGPDGDGGGALKLCGFGCATTAASKRVVAGEPEPPMGTMRYRSPEQLYGGVPRYGPEEDMWALGCVMAELAAGGAPLFSGNTEEDVLEQAIDLRDDIVAVGAEAFDGVLELELSVTGRELLAALLEFDSWERPSAADALKHRWFAEEDVKLVSLGVPHHES